VTSPKPTPANVCPKCGGEMVLRTAQKGPNPGQKFWGCSNYPKCRFTKPLNWLQARTKGVTHKKINLFTLNYLFHHLFLLYPSFQFSCSQNILADTINQFFLNSWFSISTLQCNISSHYKRNKWRALICFPCRSLLEIRAKFLSQEASTQFPSLAPGWRLKVSGAHSHNLRSLFLDILLPLGYIGLTPKRVLINPWNMKNINARYAVGWCMKTTHWYMWKPMSILLNW